MFHFPNLLKIIAFLFKIILSLHNIQPFCEIWINLSFELHGFKGHAVGE
jgi:hypothetical protein